MAARRIFWKGASSGVINTATNALVPGATGTVWTLVSGGSQVTDLQYVNAAGVSTGAVPSGVLTADSAGFVPSFAGPPDDTGLLWADFGFGRYALTAFDPKMYAVPVNGHSSVILPDVSISPTRYDVYNAAGSLISTRKVSDFASGLCAPAAVADAVAACGSGSPPTPTGGAYVDRHTVGLADGDYPVVEAAGQSYGIPIFSYWCRGLGPIGWSPATVDRALPSDELVAGPVFRWIGGSGSAGTGTATEPQTTTTKRMIQVGQAASGTRKNDNPHGFVMGPIGMVSTNTMTQFDFLQMHDCNDFWVNGTQFAGNYGVGNSCFRPYGTLAPDDGPVAWRVDNVFMRDVYRGIFTPADATGATDGMVLGFRILAFRSAAMRFESGGHVIKGSHETTSTSAGGLYHIYQVGGGPMLIEGCYFDTVAASASARHIRFGGGPGFVVGCHFKSANSLQPHIIDCSSTNAWKTSIFNCDFLANGNTSLTHLIEYPNTVNNSLFTTTAAAAAGATVVAVSATPVAVVAGDYVTFAGTSGRPVQARVTTGQAAGFAGNLAVAALSGGIASGASGTMLPVQYGGLSLHNASQATAFLAYARTVAGTSLDHLAHHPTLASRAYS
jgi:hypothetical protein